MSSESPDANEPAETVLSRSFTPTEQLARLFCRPYEPIRDTIRKCPGGYSSHTPDFLEQVRILLENGADPNFILCEYEINGLRLHRLVDKGAEDDFLEEPYSQTLAANHVTWLRDVSTPLIDAACMGDTETVSLLLEHGARFGIIIENWAASQTHRLELRNPFAPATTASDYDLLKLLLESVDSTTDTIRNWLEQSVAKALEVATNSKFDFRCTLLLDRRTYPWNRDARLFSALHIAVGHSNTDLCDRLICAGAEIHSRDLYGMSPLLEAVYYGHLKAIRILLAAGANASDVAQHAHPNLGCDSVDDSVRLIKSWPSQRDRAAESFAEKRWSAIHIAAHRGFSTILEVLINEGADIAITDRSGCTALDVAIQSSNIAIAFCLLARDCPFDPKSASASKLLAQAIEECSHISVRHLVERGVPQLIPDGLKGRYLSEQEYNMTASSCIPYPKCSQATDASPAHSSFAYYDICDKCFIVGKLFKQVIPTTGKKRFMTRRLLSKKFVASKIQERKGLKKENVEQSTGSVCNLCQLVQDCLLPVGAEATQIIRLEYIKTEGSPNRQLLTTSDNCARQHPLKMISYDWHQTLQHCASLEDGNTGSAAATAMAAHWLQRCVKSHFQCNRHLASQYSPTRILDIHGLDQGQDPKLLQNVKLDSPYVALSHRWGTEGLPSTTSANLADRMQRIPLKDLSQTMRDAIHIVKELGFRYLWIDSLSILQDVKQDWFREASCMSLVFSEAIVTIAVADADSHTQGIFRARSARCVRPFRVPFLEEMPFRDRTEFDGEGEFYVFPNSSLVSAGNRSKGTLDTRAWILQEQLLSPRVLYYGKGELFWDCITVSASESSPISASLLYDNDPDETWALKLIRRTLAGSKNTDTLSGRIADIWTQIIKNYSSRKLTRQSDKLIALEGILKPLTNILQDEPVAGMWRDQLWRQLIWWAATPSSPTPNNLAFEFSAPSWSWLSSQEPVYYHNALRGDDSQQDAGAHKFTELEPRIKIVSAESETLPGATSIRGSLTIVGPSFRYRLTANDLKKPVFKSWNAAKLKLNTGRWMLDRAVEVPLDMHCVIVAEDSVAKMLVCVCLIPDDEEGDRWRRIGLCHWDGLAWQVSKYVGKEPEERTFVIV